MNKNNKIIGIAVVIAVIASAFLFKGTSDQGSQTKKHIKIGVISILSGQFSAIGENYVKGIRLAEEQYERNNPDVEVDLVIEDDGFDTRKGISAYKKLTNLDNIDALLNLTTPTIDAIHNDVTAAQLPVIQFGIQNDGVARDTIFQVSPAADKPIRAFGEYLSKNVALKKTAIVYENGQPFDVFFKAFSETYSHDIVPMKVGSKQDIQVYATRIAKEGFDGVAILALPETGAQLIKKVSVLSKEKPQYFIDVQLQTGFADYKRILGDFKMLDGTYSVWIAAGDSGVFKTDFKEKYKEDAAMGADFGYDSFNVLMGTYNESKDIWLRNIQNLHTEGVSGKIQFDEVGIREQAVDIKKMSNGEAVTIETI